MFEAWPNIAGRIHGGVHSLPVRVYFEDTDAGGVVYHARYVAFCERGRSDFLRLLGIHQSSFSDVNFVVRRMTCEIGQEVMLNGNTYFRAHVTVALVDGRGRPRRLPEGMAQRFRSLPESQS